MLPRALPPVLIVAITIVVFFPSLQAGYVWDDHEILVTNEAYRGLAWQHLRWMASATLMGHWIPLTWVTYGVDHAIWGTNPFGYHLTSNLIHAAGVVVFYLLALRLLGRTVPRASTPAIRAGALTAALLFAIHPLRVESVTWLTERRDVLSGFWFLLTLLLYVRAAEADVSRRRWLAASIACYALAVGSKAIVMTLPVVLIVLDWYPLKRLPAAVRDWAGRAVRPLWVEKLPYVALALVAAGMAIYAQVGLADSLDGRPIPGRIAVALYGLAFYLRATLWPVEVSPIYQIPAHINVFEARFVWSAIAVASITAVLVLLRRRWPAGLAVWAIYAVLLAPVLGLTQSGPQMVAARYSYLSCLGPALLLGGAASLFVQRVLNGEVGRVPSVAVAATVALLLSALGVLTWTLQYAWRNDLALWTYALPLDRTSWLAQNNLGVSLLQEVEQQIEQGFEARGPDDEVSLANQVPVLLLQGKVNEAIRVRFRLGMVLLKNGKTAEALDVFRQEAAAAPDDAGAQTNLGIALVAAGDMKAAITSFRRALELDPGYEPARTNLERLAPW